MSNRTSLSSTGLPSPPATPSSETEIPYITGAAFIARRHEPPTTFEMGYWQQRRRTLPVTDDVSQLDWCLAHPPATGRTHSTEIRCINILETIRIGENHGAQIVLTADGYVAKLYDPLYYPFQNPSYPEEKVNVTDAADKDYIREAAAYSELLGTSLEGSIMPRYYGSWTLDIPVTLDAQTHLREVRMIILEHVPGTLMHGVDPATITYEERENIMIKLIEADIELRFAGVRHGDLEPRNVILSLPDSSTTYADPNLRLCIIDYGLCTLSKDRGLKGPAPQLYNPLHYWTGCESWSQWGWSPGKEEAIEWMWSTWGNGGKEGKYVPTERDPDSKLGKPKRPVFADSRRRRVLAEQEVGSRVLQQHHH